MSSILVPLRFCKQIHDVPVTSHDLIFVIVAVFPCDRKMATNALIYNYCLSEDLKYMDINQENKIYWLSYHREHKLFIQKRQFS